MKNEHCTNCGINLNRLITTPIKQIKNTDKLFCSTACAKGLLQNRTKW